MISIEYNMAIAEAKKLESAARDCGEALLLINRQIADSSSFWVGSSGDAMRGRLQESAAEIAKIKGQFEEIAEAIRRAAETLKEKDTSIAGQIMNFFK